MIGRRFKSPAPEAEGPKGFDDFDVRLGDLMRGERATLGKSLLDVQRDLKIKATYIAAIENADVSAFEAPGFIAGFVRSYARYLGMDPDQAFAKFCREANFQVAHGMSAAASSASMNAKRARLDENRDPIASPAVAFGPARESWHHRVEPGALGSFAVLAALILALGYGGWSVLQEVQRVQLAPVDQAPTVVAEIDPLGNVKPVVAAKPAADPNAVASAAGVTADPLDRLAQPQALSVPVLTSRDGPIAAIDPRTTGALAGTEVAAAAPAVAPATDEAVQVVAAANPGVEILAVRPSWVQVSAADGTVLFEKILDAGERYAVPPLQDAPQLRSGNSGSIYFLVNGQTFGPAAPGANVVKNVALSAAALTGSYAAADLSGDADLAEVLSVADAGSTAPAADEQPLE
ncbi:helix-turn-helix domain-containing protein [Tabrizicola oligotrophica]|nr:RodZ domain-containing protein [Tabrizicola oligotrophica]